MAAAAAAVAVLPMDLLNLSIVAVAVAGNQPREGRVQWTHLYPATERETRAAHPRYVLVRKTRCAHEDTAGNKGEGKGKPAAMCPLETVEIHLIACRI